MSPQIGFIASSKAHSFSPPQAGFEYAWIEGFSDARLARISEVPDWNDLVKWQMGRLFGEGGEYRWEKNRDGSFHGVLLLDDAGIPEGFSGVIELESIGDPIPLVLWGDFVDPKEDPKSNPDGASRFYAGALPKIQTYPVALSSAAAKDSSPRLVVRRYRDARGEKGEFMRCVAVEMLKS